MLWPSPAELTIPLGLLWPTPTGSMRCTSLSGVTRETEDDAAAGVWLVEPMT